MQKHLTLVLFLTFSSVFSVFAQPDWLTTKAFKSPERKHQIWIYWGYNRGQFSKSDIHFEGPGYDFTLNDVVAKDRQTPFAADVYLNPTRWTIPQYNIRAGFFITERLSVSLGHDHMKYVAVQDQMFTITGTVDSSASQQFAGTYDETPIQMTRDLLRFEHTNGLNYVSAEADYYGNLWNSNNKKQQLDFYVGFGMGILYPRSDVDVFNVDGVNVFHTAGWGTAIQTGIRFDFIPQIFLNLSVKGGFIHMPDILTINEGQKAEQRFFFLQEMATIGFCLNTLNRKWNEAKTDSTPMN